MYTKEPIMSNIFLCSDLHLGHNNIITFKRDDGTPLRNFSTIEEHDEYIIEQHNKVVRPQDKVYFLGDVANKKSIHKIGRMNGDKVLIKGNHDDLKPNDYLGYFRDIRGCHQFDGMLLTHIPVHTESLGRWGVNVHGHLHYRRVMAGFGAKVDERYQNVSMECLDDYTPLSLEQLKARIKKLDLMLKH